MSNKKYGGINGKGYYIALALCALAIGISGYLYYANAKPNQQEPQGTGPDATAAVTIPPEENNIPVVAIRPDETTPSGTETTLPPATVTRQPMQTASPVEGQTVAVYAMESLGYNATTRDWRVHNGVDIAADEGAKVCAAADGTVYTVYEDETMGTTVVIRHEQGYVTRYSSLAKEVSVAPGDTVKLGQQIGTVGNTALLENAIGSHVHFSVSKNDAPVNPAEFLSQE